MRMTEGQAPGVDDLVRNLGREDHLAARVTAERRRRGWSQETLAKLMTEAGCPLPQSAISKIEKREAGVGRAITVDEALTFARIFGTTVQELTLPPDAVADVAFGADFKAAIAARVAADQAAAAATRARDLLERATTEYDERVERVAEHCRRNSVFGSTMDDEASRVATETPADDYEASRRRFVLDLADRHGPFVGAAGGKS